MALVKTRGRKYVYVNPLFTRAFPFAHNNREKRVLSTSIMKFCPSRGVPRAYVHGGVRDRSTMKNL